MKKQDRLLYWIIGIFIYTLSITILYVLGATWGTIGLFVFLSLVTLIITKYIITKSNETKEKIKSSKKELISNDESEQLLKQFRQSKGIVDGNILESKRYIVKPETPEQTASEFYYQIVQDYYSNEYYLTYINKKDLEIDIKRQLTKFNNQSIKESIENSAESSREYIPIVKQTYDPYTNKPLGYEKTYKRVQQPKPIKKEEDVIGD